jgi:hypothetical protein
MARVIANHGATSDEHGERSLASLFKIFGKLCRIRRTRGREPK